MSPASYCREPSSLTINRGGIFEGFSVLRSGQGISGAPHWQGVGRSRNPMANGGALHKTKTFIAVLQLTVIAAVSGPMASFRTAGDSSECIFL
jgi:hypothetical protein